MRRGDPSPEARAFAERLARERRRWREYVANRPTYEGDWSELVERVNALMESDDR